MRCGETVFGTDRARAEVERVAATSWMNGTQGCWSESTVATLLAVAAV